LLAEVFDFCFPWQDFDGLRGEPASDVAMFGCVLSEERLMFPWWTQTSPGAPERQNIPCVLQLALCVNTAPQYDM
jgi:hypothetical protein